MMYALLLGSLVGLAPADTLPEVVRGARAARMDTLLSRAAVFGFSGQVLIVDRDTVILHKAYGWVDRARSAPMRVDSRIGIASSSKQFAAAAIQRLAVERKLSLDDSIARYLTDVPTDKRGITVKQVLSHTAGLAGGFADDFEDTSLGAIVRRVLERPLRWSPGSRWGYASEGYTIIAAIVERVSGVPWDAYLHSMFRDAGMSLSGTWRDEWKEGDVAHVYHGVRDNGSPASWPRNWRVAGAGDVITTVGDLYRWDRALAAGRIMPRGAVGEYLAPLARADSTMEYGFGLFHWTTPYGVRTIEHGGDTELGYNAAVSRYPERRSTMFVICNLRDWFGRSGRAAVGAELEAMLLGSRPDTVTLPPDARTISLGERRTLVGTWVLDDGAKIHLLDDGAQLWAAAEGQAAANLIGNRTGEQAAMLGRATTRTRELLDAIIRRDSAAADRLIGDTTSGRRADIRAAWQRYEARHGVTREAKVLGSIVRPGAALTTVLVTSTRHSQYRVAFRWGAGGSGPLTAVFDGETFPIIVGVGKDPSGALLPYDMVAGRVGVALRVSGTTLVTPDGREARAVGAVGWMPR